MPSTLTSSPEACAEAVGEVLGGVFAVLEDWRRELEETFGATAPAATLDAFVAARVLPLLTDHGLLTGAGFIAAPEFVQRPNVHFAWWLGPLDAGPIFGSTSQPTRLDLSARGYADYVRDVRTQEWWARPASTHTRHVTGPYVDHLCTCDYMLTLSVPSYIGGMLTGVVGADVSVRRLEAHLIGRFLSCPEPLALVNQAGRVVISTAVSAHPGALLPTAGAPRLPCPNSPLQLAVLG